MKYVLSFIVIFILAQSGYTQINQWRWQNPAVQGNTLQSVQMISLLTTVACGNYSTFMKTTDGGVTWDVQTDLLVNTVR